MIRLYDFGESIGHVVEDRSGSMLVIFFSSFDQLT